MPVAEMPEMDWLLVSPPPEPQLSDFAKPPDLRVGLASFAARS
jgi:hypothetical protein